MNLDQYQEVVSRLVFGERDADTRKAYQEVFDADTVKTLFKLRERGYIRRIGRVISTGKEANVFYAIDRTGSPVAVKIYRINTTEFRHMWKYVEGDPRIRVTKRNRRSIIYQWARREYKNLEISHLEGVSVPFPIAHMKNVLVMEYIGGDEPAPLLRSSYDTVSQEFTEALIDSLSRLYYRANLIHADLSDYNILVWENRPYIIDMGQSVTWEHPNAYEFFYRDMNQALKILQHLGMSISSVRDVIDLLKN